MSRTYTAGSPLPPVETPAGAPELGSLIAYEDSEATEGWSSGVVRAIEEGWEGREFTVETRRGRRRVSRELVFYWWAPEARSGLIAWG